jgi:DNA (cytosine-5)-methyltransferase 1
MRHGSLFSGIGGFDLASEWMGWENVFHCEWNEFGQKVLKYYWPKAITYNDITKTDFSIHRGSIDIITGGFPCQPYSMAGKRKGKEDERHLWPEMLRAIREIQPTWVVGENVLGLVNWDGGLVFHEVQADLEAQGYEVQPYVLPAASVNAPHRRDRVWFVAYSDHKRRSSGLREIQGENGEVSEWHNDAQSSDTSIQRTTKNSNKDGRRSNEWKKESNIRQQRDTCSRNNERIRTNDEKVGIASDTNGIGWDNRINNWEERHICSNQGSSKENKSEWERRECGTGKISTNASDSKSERLQRLHKTRSENINNRENTKIWGSTARYDKKNNWTKFPISSPICFGDDGLSIRLDSITFSKWRNESIKAGGNAIVPQVVHQIFKAIEQYNNLNK